MSKNNEINRREFLGAASAATVGFSALRNAALPGEVAGFSFACRVGDSLFSPKSWLRQNATNAFSGPQLSEVAFPLGGIGTGTVSLGGRGQLRDWEIFNRPGKGKILPFSFVALWARPEGGGATLKVVEAPLEPPYRGGRGTQSQLGGRASAI